jgi:acetylglutamate kinase
VTRLVVKVGGHALDSLTPSSSVLRELAEDISHLMRAGTEVVLVHGGGPQIAELLASVGVESRFHEGLRITDAQTMEYVAMALGHVNILISAAMNHAGLASVGVSGADGSLLRSAALGEPWLRAGAVPVVHPEVITSLWANGFCPVVSSLAVDANGELVNCNADTAAGALAGSLDADALVLLSDIDQLRRDPEDASSSLAEATSREVADLIASGAAREGMRPKMQAALDALDAGARRVIMGNGTRPHALRSSLDASVPITEVVR